MACEGLRSDGAQYSIAIISDEESTFPEICRFLAQSFTTVLAKTEGQIQSLITTPQLDGIVLDLDSIGSGSSDGLEVLKELRRIREDLFLVAITRSSDRIVRLRASQAGADDFFLAPVNFQELQVVL